MDNERKPLVRLIGIGMDGGATLTEAARAAIDGADAVFGAKRVTEPFSGGSAPVFNTWKADEISEIIKREKFRNICVLMSGDCGFYSGASRLIDKFPGFEVEVIPGISSVSYFAAKIKLPWQDMKFVSLHGVENSIVRNVRRNRYCFFLLGGDASAAHICGELCDYGLREIKVYFGENLGYPTERIVSGAVEEFVSTRSEKLCVLVTENPDFERSAQFGIDDGEFLRVSGIPMTKSEVRAVVMSKLAVGDGDICWDIGCGTGSVTVEMALQCGSGRVYGAEISDVAADLTGRNCIKFGCDNVRAYHGKAPEILEDLPAPDCVFIGGSGGKLEEILKAVFGAAKRGARVVVTAVTLDTLERCRRVFSEHGITAEIVQAAFSRVGAGSMISALNPIFIIKGIVP